MRGLCQNCAKVWKEAQLTTIYDILERVNPGEPMPAGECPDCDALCCPVYEEDPTVEEEIEETVSEFLESCDHCEKSITNPDKVYLFLDGDNFNADPEGYVIICENCAMKTLLNSKKASVVETLKLIFEMVEVM